MLQHYFKNQLLPVIVSWCFANVVFTSQAYDVQGGKKNVFIYI